MEISKHAILLTTVLMIATVFGAIACQHYWISSPGLPSVGSPGTDSLGMPPISSFTRQLLQRYPKETPLEYVDRINEFVHFGTYHCLPEEFQLSYIEKAVIWTVDKDKDLWKQGILDRKRFSCGFCHQRSFLVYSILKKHGLDAEVYGLNGHVVVRVKIDDRYYFADPDFGTGPILAVDDPSKMSIAVDAAYTDVRPATALAVREMYLSTADNGPYGGGQLTDSIPFLDALKREQRHVFATSNVIFGIMCAACAISFSFSAILVMARFRWR